MKIRNSEQAMSSLVSDSLADGRDKHVLRFVRKCIEGKTPHLFSYCFTSNYMYNIRKMIPGSSTISTSPGSELNVAKTHLNIIDV